jgi:(p)ppGpp synthase/HD superfamily hydrolase
MLTEQAVNVTVTGRMKELYSLWSKMVKHNRTLDQIQDVVALRVRHCL